MFYYRYRKEKGKELKYVKMEWPFKNLYIAEFIKLFKLCFFSHKRTFYL